MRWRLGMVTWVLIGGLLGLLTGALIQTAGYEVMLLIVYAALVFGGMGLGWLVWAWVGGEL